MNAPGFSSVVAIRAKRALILVWQELLIPPRTTVHVLGVIVVMELNFASRFPILQTFILNMIWKVCGTYAGIGILGFLFIRPRRILTPGVGVVRVKTGNTSWMGGFGPVFGHRVHRGFPFFNSLSGLLKSKSMKSKKVPTWKPGIDGYGMNP
jgi:hypothetical protein